MHALSGLSGRVTVLVLPASDDGDDDDVDWENPVLLLLLLLLPSLAGDAAASAFVSAHSAPWVSQSHLLLLLHLPSSSFSPPPAASIGLATDRPAPDAPSSLSPREPLTQTTSRSCKKPDPRCGGRAPALLFLLSTGKNNVLHINTHHSLCHMRPLHSQEPTDCCRNSVSTRGEQESRSTGLRECKDRRRREEQRRTAREGAAAPTLPASSLSLASRPFNCRSSLVPPSSPHVWLRQSRCLLL